MGSISCASVVTGGIGVVALAAGLEGYLLRTATRLDRGMLLAIALLLIDPQFVADPLRLALFGAALLGQTLRRPDPVAARAVPWADPRTRSSR